MYVVPQCARKQALHCCCEIVRGAWIFYLIQYSNVFRNRMRYSVPELFLSIKNFLPYSSSISTKFVQHVYCLLDNNGHSVLWCGRRKNSQTISNGWWKTAPCSRRAANTMASAMKREATNMCKNWNWTFCQSENCVLALLQIRLLMTGWPMKSLTIAEQIVVGCRRPNWIKLKMFQKFSNVVVFVFLPCFVRVLFRLNRPPFSSHLRIRTRGSLSVNNSVRSANCNLSFA